MDVFDYRDYRDLIRARIEQFPKKGYGQLSQLAHFIGVNATFVSQVLGGAKNFTEDQGFKAAEFFQFTEQETLYLLLLLQQARAGSHSLKKLFDKQILSKQREAQKIKGRLKLEDELGLEQQAMFYSDWLYTAIHTLTSIKRFQSIDALADHLKISRPRVFEAVDWLLRHGVCKEESGRLVVGPMTTYVDRDSPLASRHHANWRQKALTVMGQRTETDFFFTAPFSISKKDFAVIRKELVQLIDGIAKRVGDTDPEMMATINVDYFET